MFTIHRIFSRTVSSTVRGTTWKRCYCNPSKKRAIGEETTKRRGAYKSVHDIHNNQTNDRSKILHQEQTTENEQNSRSSNSGSDAQSNEKNQMIRGSFESISHKNRDNFITMVKLFETRDVHRRNHCEFIYAAMKNMREYGVHRDLTVYKALLDVMPKGKFIPTNMFQAEFNHYPKQQQCIIDLLHQMEENGELHIDVCDTPRHIIICLVLSCHLIFQV